MCSNNKKIRRIAPALLTAGLLLLAGCATTSEPDESDPWEGFNRGVHTFNETFDETIGKPVSQGYNAVMPTPVNRGVSNFFGNLGEGRVIFNDLLQGKVGQAAQDTGRLVVNSTFGILGFIDVASSMGMLKHEEDFGQTLGKWGVGTGPYLVLPFLGPNTARSTVGLVPDALTDPLLYVDDMGLRNALVALKMLDLRADLLATSRIVEVAALDKYTFTRDAYLQRREYLLHDGNQPEPESLEW